MTDPEDRPGAPKNDAYTPADWDEASDNPELTDAEIAQLRPARELPPEIFALLPKNRGGRPKAENPKALVTLRLNPQTLETFRSTGPGWQTRMSAALDAAATDAVADRER